MTKVILNSPELKACKQQIQDIFDADLEQFILEDKKPFILMTRKETAKYLCISLPTLHDWTKKGIIKANRIGYRVLYKLNDIHDALKEVRISIRREGSSC